MSKPIWPQQREDGTRSMAARFRCADRSSVAIVQLCVAAWIEEKEADASVGIRRDFDVLPWIEVRDRNTLDVVFDSRPDSRLWKGWMVQLVQQIRSSGADLLGFCDLVGGEIRSHCPEDGV